MGVFGQLVKVDVKYLMAFDIYDVISEVEFEFKIILK